MRMEKEETSQIKMRTIRTEKMWDADSNCALTDQLFEA